MNRSPTIPRYDFSAGAPAAIVDRLAAAGVPENDHRERILALADLLEQDPGVFHQESRYALRDGRHTSRSELAHAACTLGLISLAAPGVTPLDHRIREINRALEQAVRKALQTVQQSRQPGTPVLVARWNDDPGRKPREVAEFLRRVAGELAGAR